MENTRQDARDTRGQRARSAGALGLLVGTLALLAAGPVAADNLRGQARRSDKFTAPGPVNALEVTAVNGPIRVMAGAAFAATVEITARGNDQAAAEALLAKTKIDFRFEGGKVLLGKKNAEEEPSRRDLARLETRYMITLPATASVKASSVNGGIGVDAMTGPIKAATVNGGIEASRVGGTVDLETVNGGIAALFSQLPAGSKVKVQTVNGAVKLRVPTGAQLRLAGTVVNGDIVSNLPLPVLELHDHHGPPPPYQGSTGGAAAAELNVQTVNGQISVEQLGQREEEMRSLFKRNSGNAWGGGRFGIPRPPRPPRPPRGHAFHPALGEDVRLDEVPGDFVMENAGADVRVRSIAGTAKVRTVSGDVRLGSIAKAAELVTAGGDIDVKSAGGTMVARTGGGDVRIDNVAGNAQLETQGGDIHVRSAQGGIVANTRGGDITLRGIKGAVRADTAGGDITLEMVAKDGGTGIELTTNGGDVTLTLPANFRGDVTVHARGDGDEDDDPSDYIRSEFPEIKVTRAGGLYVGQGKLAGGGPRVVVRTLSGEVKIRKGPGI